jgi:hypothetical protein
MVEIAETKLPRRSGDTARRRKNQTRVYMCQAGGKDLRDEKRWFAYDHGAST